MGRTLDYDRLVMTGVLFAALLLWGGIVGEATGLYPDAKTVAAAAIGVLIPIFAGGTLVLYLLGRRDDADR